MITPKVKLLPEIYYASSWHNAETNEWHPDVRTLATTTNRARELADQHTGLNARQRRRQGFRIQPYRLTLAPAWVDDTESADNVVPFRGSP